MTSDFLADLDAAIEQRCACRCGRPITDASPSAYFASEDCAARWHLLPAGVHPVETCTARLYAAFRDIFEMFRAAFAPLVKQLVEPVEQVQPLLGDPPPPEDPQARALWLRRRRNTGPRPAHRAPRRVSPPGGFHADARGRSAYRPRPVR